jgi:hypothetical protein
LPAPNLDYLVEVGQLAVVHGTGRLTSASVRSQVPDLNRDVVRLAYPQVEARPSASWMLEDDVSRPEHPRCLQAQGEAEMNGVLGCGKPNRTGLRLELQGERIKT